MPFSGTPPNETFTRTTGLQTGSTAWADTSAAGRGIEATDQDVHDQDVATAINSLLKRDGGNKPTADIPFGGFKITDLGEPVSGTDGASKNYVDSVATGFVNFSVRAASTANVNLTTDVDDASTFDGITLATNDLILLKNQTDASENGVYVVPAGSGTAARSTSFDAWAEFVGSIINVEEGSVGAGLSFRCTVNTGGTVDVTDITYAQFGSSLVLPVPIGSGGTGQTTAALAFNALKQAATDSTTGVVEKATNAEVYSSASDKYLAADHIETASAAVVLTHGSPTALDWDAGIYRTWTMTASVTLSNPTNGQPGTWRTIRVVGNSSTDRTITFDTQYVVKPTITDVDSVQPYLLTIFCHTSTVFYVFAQALF